jgi:hypothetical protein
MTHDILQNTAPSLPCLDQALVIDAVASWQAGTAALLAGPLGRSAVDEFGADHVLLRFEGLPRQSCLRLIAGARPSATIAAMNGPTREGSKWQLDLTMSNGSTIPIEFTSVEVLRAFPGQKHVTDTDLDTSLRELLRETIHALVEGDYAVIQCLPGRATPDEIKNEILEYPATLTYPSPDAYKDVHVYAVRGKSGQWALEMDLWTVEEGQSDLTLLMDVYLVNGRLVGYVDQVHVL